MYSDIELQKELVFCKKGLIVGIKGMEVRMYAKILVILSNIK